MALRTVETRLVQLTREVDAFIARELAAQMAATAGFDDYHSSDIETAVSEICSNALRYGTRGWAALTLGPGGFEAVITDEGPGFDVPRTVRSGLGVGLEGARRLMDDLTIEALPTGSRVTIKKTRGSADEHRTPSGYWELTVVNRLKKGNSTSGDMWWSREDADTIMLAVLDGLGSGPQAEEASATIVAVFEESAPAAALDKLVHTAHEAARPTRGAVGVVARIDDSSIEYCGVGDANARIEPGGDTILLGPGIMGVDIGEPQVRRHTWTADSRLAVWTDGLDLPSGAVASIGVGEPAAQSLVALSHEHGTERDDGLLLFARRGGEQR
jgi:anti-sigma regulatory factor (Ser/Thr protein kinase)